MERMKGQRLLLSLWAWRERLCAEMPIKAVALGLQFFMSFRPSFSFQVGCQESQFPSGIQPRTDRSQRREKFFMAFVPFMSFLFRLLESQPTSGTLSGPITT